MGRKKKEEIIKNDEKLDDVENTEETNDVENTEEKTNDTNNTEIMPIDMKSVTLDVSDEDREALSTSVESADALYSEFSSFLKNSGVDESRSFKYIMPTGIKILDAFLGGGFVTGALSIIVGTPGSGKSMLASQTLGNCQKKYKSQDFFSFFADSEESNSRKRLSQLGVNDPMMEPMGDITIEKVFKIISGMCIFKTEKKIIDSPSLFICDSIANTNSEKEREASDPKSVVGYKARLLSFFLPSYISKLSLHNIGCIAVNQLRDKLNLSSPFHKPSDLKILSNDVDMPGGKALKYNAFQLIELNVRRLIDQEKEKEKFPFNGLVSEVKVVKNKLFPPNIKVDLIGTYQSGFSDFWTSWNFLDKTKRLKIGAWNYLINLPEKKFRTKDVEVLYKDDPEFKKAFDDAVDDAIRVDIIEKYDPDHDKYDFNDLT